MIAVKGKDQNCWNTADQVGQVDNYVDKHQIKRLESASSEPGTRRLIPNFGASYGASIKTRLLKRTGRIAKEAAGA